jgi:NAD(P)-dependent dehydrogenase (short-subunit alcohol dehydrogenase family)
MDLQHKIALITGGSSGIGQAIALLFAAEGAEIIVFDRVKPAFPATWFPVDIRNEEDIRHAISQIETVDIVVNNAGVYFQESVETTTVEQLDTITDVNFKGTYLLCKHVLPLLKRTKGTIINMASALGMVPELSSPAYCATKAAVIMLTKCLAQEYATHGIRINAILPGPIDTPLLRKSIASESDLVHMMQKNPMRKIGTPEDVANVALFLASAKAGYVTGSLYPVDGGESSSSVYSK